MPDPAELGKRVTPHARGAILVAAVFDAFLAIYRVRTADLLRIYTGGTGVLPSGAMQPSWAGESRSVTDFTGWNTQAEKMFGWPRRYDE